MSKENLVKLLQAAAEDEQLGQQLQSTSNYEELKSLARTQGFDLGDISEAEVKRTVGIVTGTITEELTDEELEMVAGGFVYGKVTWDRQKVSGNTSNFTATDDLWK
jgi:predicted ribosomally synthesized peptide with nif11-like leader